MDRFPLDLSLEDSLTTHHNEFYLDNKSQGSQSPPPQNNLKSNSACELDANIELNKRLFFDSPPKSQTHHHNDTTAPTLNSLRLLQSPPPASSKSHDNRSREMTPDSIDSSLTTSLVMDANFGSGYVTTTTGASISLEQLQQLLQQPNAQLIESLTQMLAHKAHVHAEEMPRVNASQIRFDEVVEADDADEAESRDGVDAVGGAAVMPVLEDGLSDTEVDDERECASSDFVYESEAGHLGLVETGGTASGGRPVSAYSPSSSSISNSPPPQKVCVPSLAALVRASADVNKQSVCEREYDTDEETNRLLEAEQRSLSGATHGVTDAGTRKPAVAPKKHHKTSRPREIIAHKIMDPDNQVLIEGVLFRANYLGSTQLNTDSNPTKLTRMMQAQEAVARIKVTPTPSNHKFLLS